MKTRKFIKGKEISFEIVEDTGETIEQLATWMAESMGRKVYYESQVSAFRQQCQNERVKATQRNTIMFQLKEYNRQKRKDIESGIQRNVSRMEPMETYDAEVLKQERDMFQDRANEFHKTADNFASMANKEGLKISEYQKRIEELRKINDSIDR